jgi:glycosyltransferase involved in cell wall biosynthesis
VINKRPFFKFVRIILKVIKYIIGVRRSSIEDEKRQLKVGFDARFTCRQPVRGIGNYSIQLINQITSMNPEISFMVYVDRADSHGSIVSRQNVNIKVVSFFNYVLWEHVALPVMCWVHSVDVLHCLGNTGPIIRFGKCRLVVTIHDAMFMHSSSDLARRGSVYQSLGRAYRKLLVPIVAERANIVITMSKYSRQDILESISAVSPGKVFVVYQSCNDSYSSVGNESRLVDKSARKNKKKFILVLGAEDPRKNTAMAVKAFTKVSSLYPDKDLELVVVGYVNYKTSAAYALAKVSEVFGNIKFFEYVSNDDLKWLYMNAEMLLYPTIFEGFGIPLLEAMSAGCPVVCSNVTSIPEVAGDAARYVNPNSIDEISAGVLQVLVDRKYREQLILSGLSRSDQFNWANAARETVRHYFVS